MPLRRTGTPVSSSSKITGVPALRSSTSQGLRAASRPGHKTKAPPGGDGGAGLLSLSRDCGAPERIIVQVLVDHLNDAAGARFDQHGLAIHDRVTVRCRAI